MKKLLLTVMLFMIMYIPVNAAGLDDSGEKKVTVRSEIVRGDSATSATNLRTAHFSPIDYIDNVFKVNDMNKQRNTDTDGYYLGAYYQAWSSMVSNLNVIKENTKWWESHYSKSDTKYINDVTRDFFKSFREKQKQLGLSDDDLFEALGYQVSYKEEFKSKITQWEQQPPN